MPVYESECTQCGGTQDYLRSVAQCLDTPMCAVCGIRMEKRVFSAPLGYLKGNFAPFKSTVDGSIISTHRDMVEHNKRNNVLCLADGYSDERVKSGQIARKPDKLDVSDLQHDIAEATLMVNNGYRPEVHTDDD
jgi:putative FmdB family regulatory protein